MSPAAATTTTQWRAVSRERSRETSGEFQCSSLPAEPSCIHHRFHLRRIFNDTDTGRGKYTLGLGDRPPFCSVGQRANRRQRTGRESYRSTRARSPWTARRDCNALAPFFAAANSVGHTQNFAAKKARAAPVFFDNLPPQIYLLPLRRSECNPIAEIPPLS